MPTYNIEKEFYHRLVNRDSFQGDGKHNAVEFRNKFLKTLDNAEAWNDPKSNIELDFSGVSKIGPSFANEAFAYFMKYTNPGDFRKRVIFKNLSKVKEMIIDTELRTGYAKK